MTDKQQVIQLVEQFLLETGSASYLVDVTVSRNNEICVEIDNDEAVDIDECVELNRYIDQHLDREIEDFELEVGSAGLTSPLKTLRQFAKYEGQTMEVSTRSGEKLRGILGKADAEGFDLTVLRKVKPEGSKRKVEISQTLHLLHSEVNQVKYDFQ